MSINTELLVQSAVCELDVNRNDVVEISCSNPSCRKGTPHFMIRRSMLSGDRVVADYRGKDFESFFVSPYGFVYCSRECWAAYCED